LLWTRHADAVKAASPTTAWLTSDALDEWNFGTISQRLDRGVLGEIASRVVLREIGLAGIALLAVAVIAVVRSPQRWFWLGIALAALLPPLAFINLYLVHDYYIAAVSPAIAALLGLGAGFVWRLVSGRPLAVAIAVGAGVLVVFSTLAGDRDYWQASYDADPHSKTLALARELESLTQPDDRVAVIGLDWSPAVLYYAHRWGQMVVEPDRAAAYEAIHADGYRYLLIRDPLEDDDDDLTTLGRWRWLGALGPHTYGIADEATALADSQFIATDDAGAIPSGRVLSRGLRIRCGERTAIPSGNRGTLIVPSGYRPTARLIVSDELAPLPVRRAIFVGPRVADGRSLTLRCTGQPALVVDVLEARPPSDA
jgi:hypothetical protein